MKVVPSIAGLVYIYGIGFSVPGFPKLGATVHSNASVTSNRPANARIKAGTGDSHKLPAGAQGFRKSLLPA
jgi:hypothetical protein